MVVIFVLLEISDTGISPKVFDILQPLNFFDQLSETTSIESPMSGLENLSCAAAQRCINSLMNDSYSNSAAFALECPPLILPESKLSPELNEACLFGRKLTYASAGRSLAYDFMGRSYAETRHSATEMYEITRVLERNARKVMQKYMERYAEGEVSGAQYFTLPQAVSLEL